MGSSKQNVVKFSVRTRALREAQADLQRIYREIAPFVKERKVRVYRTEGRWTLSSTITDAPAESLP